MLDIVRNRDVESSKQPSFDLAVCCHVGESRTISWIDAISCSLQEKSVRFESLLQDGQSGHFSRLELTPD